MTEMPEEKNGEVIQMLGDGRYKLKCNDKINRIGLLRGSLRRQLNLQIGDKVVIQLREFETHKCDIISKKN